MDDRFQSGLEETADLSTDDAAEVKRAEELLDAVQQDTTAQGGTVDRRITQAATILEGLAPESDDQPGAE